MLAGGQHIVVARAQEEKQSDVNRREYHPMGGDRLLHLVNE